MTLPEELLTGVGIIDEQHETFFSALNKLSAAFRDKLTDDEINAALDFLEVYTETHFNAEEYYMSQYGFTALSEHKEQHRLFTSELENLRVQVSENDECNEKLFQVAEVMMRWAVHHIKESDKEFASFLKENGLQLVERSAT